jgi:hypothetical protein
MKLGSIAKKKILSIIFFSYSVNLQVNCIKIKFKLISHYLP